MIRRKREEEEHENHERWLVSYADFITLLFAFFVVMYAISSVNDKKYKKLSESINNAFSSTPPVISRSMNDQDSAAATSGGKSLIKPLPLAQLHYQKLQIERESMTRLGMNLSDKLSPMIQDGKVNGSFKTTVGCASTSTTICYSRPGRHTSNPGANRDSRQDCQSAMENDRAIQVRKATGQHAHPQQSVLLQLGTLCVRQQRRADVKQPRRRGNPIERPWLWFHTCHRRQRLCRG